MIQIPCAVTLRPRILTLEINNDISKYLKVVAEFFHPTIEKDILSQIMSAILFGVMTRDDAEPFDAFERIVAKCDLHAEEPIWLNGRSVRREEIAWTHFMQLSNLFTVRYKGSKEFIQDLEDLVREDERGPSEELFHVLIAHNYRLMQIS